MSRTVPFQRYQDSRQGASGPRMQPARRGPAYRGPPPQPQPRNRRLARISSRHSALGLQQVDFQVIEEEGDEEELELSYPDLPEGEELDAAYQLPPSTPPPRQPRPAFEIYEDPNISYEAQGVVPGGGVVGYERPMDFGPAIPERPPTLFQLLYATRPRTKKKKGTRQRQQGGVPAQRQRRPLQEQAPRQTPAPTRAPDARPPVSPLSLADLNYMRREIRRTEDRDREILGLNRPYEEFSVPQAVPARQRRAPPPQSTGGDPRYMQQDVRRTRDMDREVAGQNRPYPNQGPSVPARQTPSITRRMLEIGIMEERYSAEPQASSRAPQAPSRTPQVPSAAPQVSSPRPMGGINWDEMQLSPLTEEELAYIRQGVIESEAIPSEEPCGTQRDVFSPVNTQGPQQKSNTEYGRSGGEECATSSSSTRQVYAEISYEENYPSPEVARGGTDEADPYYGGMEPEMEPVRFSPENAREGEQSPADETEPEVMEHHVSYNVSMASIHMEEMPVDSSPPPPSPEQSYTEDAPELSPLHIRGPPIGSPLLPPPPPLYLSPIGSQGEEEVLDWPLSKTSELDLTIQYDTAELFEDIKYDLEFLECFRNRAPLPSPPKPKMVPRKPGRLRRADFNREMQEFHRQCCAARAAEKARAEEEARAAEARAAEDARIDEENRLYMEEMERERENVDRMDKPQPKFDWKCCKDWIGFGNFDCSEYEIWKRDPKLFKSETAPSRASPKKTKEQNEKVIQKRSPVKESLQENMDKPPQPKSDWRESSKDWLTGFSNFSEYEIWKRDLKLLKSETAPSRSSPKKTKEQNEKVIQQRGPVRKSFQQTPGAKTQSPDGDELETCLNEYLAAESSWKNWKAEWPTKSSQARPEVDYSLQKRIIPPDSTPETTEDPRVKFEMLNTEFMYYASLLKKHSPNLKVQETRDSVAKWVKKLFGPGYHVTTELQEKRNRYLMALTIGVISNNILELFLNKPPTGDLGEPNLRADIRKIKKARWELDELWQDVLRGLPDPGVLEMPCGLHGLGQMCPESGAAKAGLEGKRGGSSREKDAKESALLDREYHFLLYLAHGYASNLDDPYEKTTAATWLHALSAVAEDTTSEDYADKMALLRVETWPCPLKRGVRNDYMQVLLASLMESRLDRLFLRPPPDNGDGGPLATLKVFAKSNIIPGKNYSFSPTSPLADKFLFKQPLPKEGAFAFMALSGDSLDSWFPDCKESGDGSDNNGGDTVITRTRSQIIIAQEEMYDREG